MIWVFPHFSPIKWHFRIFHASLNCVKLNKYSRDSQSRHNSYWNFRRENPQKELWSGNTHQGLFPSVGRGPFLWCVCWFLYFPYRTSLGSGNTGHSWQVASQAGNGDSLVSGMQNFSEQCPPGLERVYLWYSHRGSTLVEESPLPRHLFPLLPKSTWPCQLWAVHRGNNLGCEAGPTGQESIPLPAGKDSKWEQEGRWSCGVHAWDPVRAFLALGQRWAVLPKWFLYLMEVKCQT